MGLTDQQKRAVDADIQNIIVSAGAGSGKTKVLSERVYQHLVKGIDIDEMLVLTFTKAAAAQMKKRIRQRILLNQDNELSKENQQRQLNKIDSAYIMTFDAFSLQLVQKYHYLLNIDKDIANIDENILLVKTNEILDEIMNQHYQSQDSAFSDLINHFCVKDDRIIRDSVISLNKKLSLMYDRQEYLTAYQDKFFSKHACLDKFHQYEKIVLEKVQDINLLADGLSFYDDIDKNYAGLEDLIYCDNYQSIRECYPMVSTLRRLGLDEAAKPIKDNISKALKELGKLINYDSDTLIKQYQDTCQDALTLISLTNELEEKLMAYKKQENCYEFSDIAKMAIDLIKDNEGIAKQVRSYFKEILVDEYQDTSDLQEELISRIGQNNIYMVGDIKQSIYRFRNANPQLFKQKYEQYQQGNGGVAIDLTANFRSRDEVLDDINVFFERIMSSSIGGANYNQGHRMSAGNVGLKLSKSKQNYNCEILGYEYNSREKVYPFDKYKQHLVECYVVANDIKHKLETGYQIAYEDEASGEIKLRNCTYKDFAIMCDRNTRMDDYKAVLTSFGIPSSIAADENLLNSDLMMVIAAIFKMLRCIIEHDEGNQFKHSYLSLARSFLCKVSDEEIYQRLHQGTINESEIYQKLSLIGNSIDNKSITMVMDEIIEQFDLYQKINLIGDVQNNLIKIDYLYQLAQSLSESGNNYLDFDKYLENIFVQDNSKLKYNVNKDDTDAVILTNIHQSKGLEYSVCYYIGLGVKFNREDEKQSVLFDRRSGVIIPTYHPQQGLKDTIGKAVFKYNNNKEDISEKIRLFYVALTRAKEKMIIVTPLQDKSDDGKEFVKETTRLKMNCFADMIDSIYEQLNAKGYIKMIDFNDISFEAQQTSLNNPTKQITKVITLKDNVVVKPQLVEQSSFSKDPGLINKETLDLMSYGKQIHYYLQTLDFNNPDFSMVERNCAYHIQKFLNSDLMINAKNGIAHKEYEFIYRENGIMKHGFIDLLMEYDDHYDIIDYKLKNIDDQHYDEQLNGYRNYICTLTDKPVYCYLYSIIDSSYRKV